MTYLAIKCNNCGNWNTCEVLNILTYTFKCRRCNKSSKLKKGNKFGLSNEVKRFNTPDYEYL